MALVSYLSISLSINHGWTCRLATESKFNLSLQWLSWETIILLWSRYIDACSSFLLFNVAYTAYVITNSLSVPFGWCYALFMWWNLLFFITGYLTSDVILYFTVAVTQIGWRPKGLLIDQFDSREDLINALFTSSFIPGYVADDFPFRNFLRVFEMLQQYSVIPLPLSGSHLGGFFWGEHIYATLVFTRVGENW